MTTFNRKVVNPKGDKEKGEKADKSLREEISGAVDEQERQRILAEQAPRLREAQQRVQAADSALAQQPPPQAQPPVDGQQVPPQGQPVQPVDRPVMTSEVPALIDYIRNTSVGKAVRKVFNPHGDKADAALKQGE